ncbi:MAG: hypothetical protein EOP06_14255 [Proteobacteria bacterium]|nr:MAG: hypothetical protein EOP06_14255 [Pseudomonadota bacterium]
MKNLVMLAAVSLLPQLSQAYIVACSAPAYLIPALEVVKENRCVGGLALIDYYRNVRCTHSSDGSVRMQGTYRACVTITDNGIVINTANGIGAE